MLKKQYVDWAYRELKRDAPYKRVLDDWLVNWTKTLVAINKVHGIFEITAIVFSRCEFLGSLYRGNTDKSHKGDFKLYLNRFFKPEYKKLHKITSNKDSNSEIYTIFRHKILHSGQPVGIQDGDEIIGWYMGYGSYLKQHHLRIDDQGNLNINCRLLVEDFLESIQKYAAYLQRDRGILNNKKPSSRWYEAFWATFCPLYCDKNEWMNELKFLNEEIKVYKSKKD